eukprot:g11529.t1
MTTLSPDETEIGKTCIALFLSIWVAGMLQVFKRHTARLKQIWGIKSEEEIIVQVHADWDHERVGVPGWVVNLFTVLFLACYMGGIFGVLAWQYSLEEDSFFYSYSSVILTVVIKGGSFIWGLLAPCLVGLENIRKESAFTEAWDEDKLSGLLAGVKLFVANWPFIAHAFLTNYLQRTCGASHEEAAGKVYPDFDPAHDNGAILKVLKEQWAYKRGHQVCLPGCMPESWRSMATQYTTSCEADLESNLTTYFFFAIEYKKMQTVDPEEGGPTYKFLEWEAKKFPYEFNSWGGDKINDYLDSAISYSVIACWGSIAPIMFVFGCISFYASYRLRTYRMLYVTQRPLPRVACGLGVWASIFSAINASAVATNHVVLVLQSTVQFLVSDNPKDVEEIGFYNEHASSLLRNDASTHHAQVLTAFDVEKSIRPAKVSPSVVQAVGQAVRLSQVPRSELFISMLWEPPLDTSAKLDSLTEQLGFVDLMILPQTPELESVWKHLERLKARKRFKALGVKDFRPEEVRASDGANVEFLPGNGESVEYAQCAFTPYRHGPRRDTWRRFGQREVALAATGLFTDWPRPLPPLLDPHVLIIARRFKRSAAQVLIRWALQLGLAVVFHSQRNLEYGLLGVDSASYGPSRSKTRG